MLNLLEISAVKGESARERLDADLNKAPEAVRGRKNSFKGQ